VPPTPRIPPAAAANDAPGASGPLVVARQLTRVYGSGPGAVRAVDGVDLSIDAGEVILVFGPSGCGKSTLLAILGGLDRGYGGSLSLFGVDVARLGDHAVSRLRGERIGFVFQDFQLLTHLDVLQNVTAPSLFTPGYQSRPVRERGLEVLKLVGLTDRVHAYPDSLSGGQRQRVAIARAIFNRPALLLCDEPTGNLDRDTGAQIIELFATLHHELRTTMVIVTHEDRLTSLEHRVLNMLDGKLVGEKASP
jgi:putative ABC transport system ATP-binding protein